MSDESDASTAGDALRESLGETLEDAVDEAASGTEEAVEGMGRQLGSRIGREAGGVIGRELGGVVAVDIREGEGLRTILADVKRRSLELLAALLRNVDVEPVVAWLIQRGKGLVGEGSAGSLVDAAGTIADRAEDTAETVTEADAAGSIADRVGEAAETVTDADEPDAEAETEADEPDAEAETEADESDAEAEPADEAQEDADGAGESDEATADPSSMSAEDLQELRSETYRELLEKMSYRELQSIAKEVDVKANLSQDELTDRIVEAFSEGSEA